MAGRRLSRGTPLMYGSRSEQEAGVRAIDSDAEVVAAIEQITGRAWSTLGFGDKVEAIDQRNEMGAAVVQIVAAEKAKRELLELAAATSGEIKASERLTLVEAECDSLREELRRTSDAYAKLRARVEANTAAPAMAVHS